MLASEREWRGVDVGGAAVELTLSAPAVVTAGVPFTITPRANDQFGNPASGYVSPASALVRSSRSLTRLITAS